MNRTKKLFLLGVSVIIIFAFSKCTTFTPNPPAAGPCTFTIYPPAKYECYLNHAGTGRKIILFINLTTRFINPNNTGPQYLDYADSSITIDPSVTPFPVTLTLNAPSGYFVANLYMQGTECSPCANGTSIPDEIPYGDCPQVTITSTNPWTYRAALPRWEGDYRFQKYQPTATLDGCPRTTNLPNSCGCTVQ
jgi:hypothetical protein